MPGREREPERGDEPDTPILFLRVPPEFHEHDSVFTVTFISGGKVYRAACTPHIYLAALEGAHRCYDAWDAENKAAQGIRSTKPKRKR